MHKINHSKALTGNLRHNFSISFPATIWNTVALPEESVLFIEIRDEQRRSVHFSAVRYSPFSSLWENIEYSERWWISLLTATGRVVLFQQYVDGKPDQKKLIAADYASGKVVWEKDYFSFYAVYNGLISGTMGAEDPVEITLDPATGEESKKKIDDAPEISTPLRPFQYYADTPYFRTVEAFLMEAYRQKIEGFVEYREFGRLVVVSYYRQMNEGLTNYLLVINEKGEELLLEKVDEGLKGLGTDTFFLLSGCLFFVRNKRELLSYQIL